MLSKKIKSSEATIILCKVQNLVLRSAGEKPSAPVISATNMQLTDGLIPVCWWGVHKGHLLHIFL